MASLKLEGNNLGEIHRSFNRLVKETIITEQIDLTLNEDGDLQNLMIIEVAAAKRKVDFLLEVLKGDDMLYISRALNRITWLITDNQYAHIINPEYLYKNQIPYMTLKAQNKLLLTIRLNLKNEARVEEFYKYISVQDDKIAYKWLQHCSVPFIEEEIRKNHKVIPDYFQERLARRAFSIFVEVVKNQRYRTHNLTLTEHCDKYVSLSETDKLLHFIENSKHYFKFNPKLTKYILKTYPERIIKKIDRYMYIVDVNTFAKYIKDKQNINKKIFPRLCRHCRFFQRSNIKNWIHFLPKEDRFELIRKYVINKEKFEKGDILLHLCVEGNHRDRNTIYELYKYAPFDIAFEDIKKLISNQSNPDIINSMSKIILSTTGNDMNNIRALLEYYVENHIHESYTFKIEFINAILAQTDTHTFDNDTWNILNKLFVSVDVYVKSRNNVQDCVEAIIVRNIIRGEDIPEIVKTKFKFNTLKTYEKKLKSQDDRDAVFTYLYNFLNSTLDNKQLHEVNFLEYTTTLENILNLLKDWEKSIKDYPSTFNKIRSLIEINKVNNYEADLSPLYHKNKEWTRDMFEESLSLDLSDKVCVYVLKHDANLVKRHIDQVMSMINSNKILLKQSLKKIRVYWPNTLAKEVKASCLNMINDRNVDGYKALITGICLLLSRSEMKMFLENYAPIEENFNKNEDHVIDLRRNIGKNFYKARPQGSMNLLLPYAKGLYLQSTIPSFYGILHQLDVSKFKQCISELIHAPASLQKIAIRYTYQKLSTDDLIPIYDQIWGTTEKSPRLFSIKKTVRMVLLICARKRMCKEKEESKVYDILNAMNKWLKEATCKKDLLVHKLADMSNIPQAVKSEYFTMVYKFLLTYRYTIPKGRFRPPINKMRRAALEIIEILDEDFVFTTILEKMDINRKLYNFTDLQYNIFAALILQSNEEEQLRRCNKFLVPIIEFNTKPLQWAKSFVHPHTKRMLRELLRFKQIIIDKNKNMPIKVFKTLQLEFEKHLGYERGYTTITYLKLATEFIKQFDDNKHILNAYYEGRKEKYVLPWPYLKEIYEIIVPKFGKFCAETLIYDVNKFYPTIYTLFTISMKDFMDDCLSDLFGRDRCISLNIYKCILESGSEKELCLAICPLIRYEIPFTKEGKLVREIMSLIYPNLSPELKMHYYQWFHGEP